LRRANLRKASFFFLLCFFFGAVLFVQAQEEEPLAANGNAEIANGINGLEAEAAYPADDAYGLEQPQLVVAEPEEPHPDAAHLEMEIRTSSLMELAAWARELGLSDGGTREELASRLRSYFRLAPPRVEALVDRVITIESATTTEYFTLDVVNEDYARFRGGVVISLRDGNAVHQIRAGEILYNRTRNVLTASGGVEYTRAEGNTIETFRGESITVNLDNWSGIFIDGVSERSVAGRLTAYRFAGTVISRDGEGATLLRNAVITNPANEEAFWSITASKLWLLPGNDFAILNAVLRVGNIPLFYLPFFYFPADQVVFRPVLGYRTREGTFFQTTTYILGRPRTEVITESSISMIFGGAGEDMETERHGIFLRTTGERRQDPGDVRLALLFDAYVNLGIYLGAEFAIPGSGPRGAIEVSAGIGLTRNIYPMALGHTPFPNFDGVSEWNRSRFFFAELPVRYRFRMTGSYRIPYGSLSWVIPLYSDPFVERDFMRRPQPRDWFSMLRELAEGEDEHEVGADTFLSSYEWRLSGNFTFPVANLRPFITTLSISSFSSSMLFNMRNSASYTGPHTRPNPDRAFFFPQRFTIYSLSANIAGNPFTFGAAPAPVRPTPGQIPAPPGLDLLPDRPISPWATEEEEEEFTAPLGEHTLRPPVLAQTFQLRTGGGPRLAIDYRLSPTSATEMQFNSRGWQEQDQIDWGDISSILTRVRADGSLGFNLTHAGGGAYTATLRLSGTGSWQGYAHINDEADEFAADGAVEAALRRAQRETFLRSEWNFTTSVRPFFQSNVWGSTNFTHNIRGLLARNTFDTETEEREWEFGSWDRDNIMAHQVSANVVASIRDRNQTLSLSAVLPPRDATASANATLTKWISTTSIRGSVREPWDSELRTFEPIHITETLNFAPRINFQQVVVYNVEERQFSTVTSRLNILNFNVNYSMRYARPWRFNPNFHVGSGLDLWTQRDEHGEFFYNRLEPQELRFGYARTFSRDNLWGGRLALSVGFNTNMAFDLQRHTNSRLNFSMNVTTRITNFLDLSFSAVSENAVLFRYFQNMPFFATPPDNIYPGQETNIFVDLLNSFRFDSRELRESSGFKLRSISVALTHHLGDWNARLTVSSSPILDRSPGAPPSYRFRNEVSFLVQWVPIEEIRTQIDYIDGLIRVR